MGSWGRGGQRVPKIKGQKSMTHLNNSILCAIDIETTGLDPKKHDITEIAILPLNNEIQPMPGIIPFTVNIRPERLENIDYDDLAKVGMSRDRITKYINEGYDSFYAFDLFERWFNLLQMPLGKKIHPLCHNYPFERAFLTEWMGQKNYDHYIDHRYRDTMILAIALNDRADHRMEEFVPFPKVNLQYCCSQLKVERARAHYAIDDAAVTAECYRKMIKM